MSEVRGGTGARGNPPPRRALSRVRPLDAEDRPGTPPLDPTVGTTELSPAAAPGGTEGRDLLIPGRQPAPGAADGRGKTGPPVPSLADLMPPAAPSGRRHGAGTGGHGKAGHAKGPVKGAVKSAEGEDKGAKTVELTVRLPKPVRKKLKAQAAELGLSPEDAVARLVEVWLEG
jgi:hypothetical protein